MCLFYFSLLPITKKLFSKIYRLINFSINRTIDFYNPTYTNSNKFFNNILINNLNNGLDIYLIKTKKLEILALANLYLDHRFDLLGSGWVQVKHGIKCRGLEEFRYEMGEVVHVDPYGHWLKQLITQANLRESQRIWSLVAPSYIPIDWQLDFKSGYRWNESTWYMDVPLGYYPGREMKIPWELSRCQHFHMLVLAYALTSDQEYLNEYRNQVLDFISTNPPRYGMNWRCTMDVAIRVANCLVAYDLFRAYGAEFDSDFEAEFSRSIYQHGCHIINNLEWSTEHRANHYLANIVGLLFVAAYLPRTPETDVWLAFTVQELIVEVEYQFYPDGGNFEASTSYHRLSAEMVVYATALVLGLPPEKQVALKEYNHRLHRVHPKLKPAPLEFYPLPGSDRLILFPAWYIERLEKMAEFTMHITKPNGHIPQIGDNDNGRFLKLQPIYHQMTVAEAKARYANLEGYTDLPDDAIYWDEDSLDHRHLVAAINGLFRRDDFAAFTGEGWLETDLIRCLAGGTRLPSYLQLGQRHAAESVRVGTEEDWVRLTAELDSVPQEQGKQRQVLEIAIPGDDLYEELKLYAYPDFGLYLYRSNRLYMAVRCGAIGQNGKGGHAHNDQLSIELNVDGEDWITDPGTYLYTPLPERRNQYRSVKAHFAPQPEGQEPGRLNLGLFQLGNEVTLECLYFGKEGFVGCQKFSKFVIERLIHLYDRGIIVNDNIFGDDNIPLIDINCQLAQCRFYKYSPAYGVYLNKKLS